MPSKGRLRRSLLGFRLVLALVAAGAWSPLAGNAADELSIAVARVPLSTPIFVAEARGFFAAEGIAPRIVDCTGGYMCLTHALEGKTDLATAADLPVMFRSFERRDFAVLATFATTPNDLKLIARKSPGIAQPVDLRGKRVGFVLGSSSQYFLDTFLLLHGLDSSRVQLIEISPEKAPRAIATRQIDALSIFEPYGYLALQALGTDGHVLRGLPAYRLRFNLIGRKTAIAERKDAIVKVLRALDQAMAFIRAHPARAQELSRERLDLDRAAMDAIWRDLTFALALEQSLVVTLENEARWAIRRGHRKGEVPDYLEFLAPEALRTVRPAAVRIVK